MWAPADTAGVFDADAGDDCAGSTIDPMKRGSRMASPRVCDGYPALEYLRAARMAL